MDMDKTYSAFAGHALIAAGPLKTMILGAKAWTDRTADDPTAPTLLVFEDDSGQQIDFDLHGTPNEVIAKLAFHPTLAAGDAERARAGRGRPKLGVTSREVTLLPRHWAWLESQSGGVSGALRRLVEEARKRESGRELARRGRDAASRVMWALAGNLPNFEEASRALFADDPERFGKLTRGWPDDVRDYLCRRVDDAARLEREAPKVAPEPDPTWSAEKRSSDKR